jgi:hypothetical protein
MVTLMTPWMNEGFFADVAVLVEGEDDRAALLGAALARGIDLESDGCAIIPCNGKSNLDRSRSIFEGLGIPTFILWDSDAGMLAKENVTQAMINQATRENRLLLRLVAEPEEDWPSKISGNFACFKDKLEVTLRDEIGSEDFDVLIAEAQTKYGIGKRKHALKNPLVIAELLKGAATAGQTSATLTEIVSLVLKARKPGAPETMAI